jgi:hypothetical protein
VNKGIYGNNKPMASASPFSSSGLSITKSGDWAIKAPAQQFTMVAPQAIFLSANNGDVYARHNGKWIAAWQYDENNWATTGGPRITSLSFDDLEGSVGIIGPNNLGGLTNLSFPALVVAGGFQPFSMPELRTLSTPALRFVTASYNPSSMPLVTEISLPALTHAFSTLGFVDFAALTTFSAPRLEWVTTNFTFGTAASLTAFSVPSLRYVGGNLQGSAMASLTTLAFPSLAYVGGSGSLSFTTTPLLANFTLPTDGTLKYVAAGTFAITSAALTVQSVDNVLQAFASLDGTNGTTSYGAGKTINLTGGTSAAPSNLGSTTTAGSNFVCAGTTCTVNWTAHGYATGDVLRVSGITTATNANRYARITVVNANQFTYAITSQTATGAGTATVVKAGASAKALVTRGVTLTTN